MLQEFITVRETSVVRAPRHLGIEAACLPIAALTAWNVLRDAAVSRGQTVIIIGTGGVSLFALQFTQLLGAEPIVVSRGGTKLRRISALGARAVIDSTVVPNWGERVLTLTDGRGADVIVEVGGARTFPQSSIALRVGGHIAIVGYLSGPEVTLDLRSLFIGKRAHLQGHTVGSRASFGEMNRALEAQQVIPVIDRTFTLEQTRAAYERAQSGEALGKVLITL
jgi:NADPH:quinone reductase-like Zn-dependent oxidoreductase